MHEPIKIPELARGDTHVLEYRNAAHGWWHDRGYYPGVEAAQRARDLLVADGYEPDNLRIRELTGYDVERMTDTSGT